MYRIFISHKHEDAEAASEIKNILQKPSDRLDVWVSEKDIPIGGNWDEEIVEALHGSNMLLLLFTELKKDWDEKGLHEDALKDLSKKDWDWCLYETGFFKRPLKDFPQRKIVCFYRAGNNPPRPLSNLQAVPITPVYPPLGALEVDKEIAKLHNAAKNSELIEKFLKGLYLKTELTGLEKPLNDRLEDSDFVEMAWKIARLFNIQEVEQTYCTKRLHLEYGMNLKFEEDKIPESVDVQGYNGALQIFGINDRDNCKMDELISNAVESGNQLWINGLAKAIFNATKGKATSTPIDIHDTENNKFYRAILYRVDRTGNRPFRFWVLLNKEPSVTKPVKWEFPQACATITICRDGTSEHLVSEASSLFKKIFCMGNVDEIPLGELFERFSKKMYESQLAQFNKEQQEFISDLTDVNVFTKETVTDLNAKYPVVFKDNDEFTGRSYLPIIAQYCKTPASLKLRVVYVDVTAVAKPVDGGLFVCSLSQT